MLPWLQVVLACLLGCSLAFAASVLAPNMGVESSFWHRLSGVHRLRASSDPRRRLNSLTGHGTTPSGSRPCFSGWCSWGTGNGSSSCHRSHSLCRTLHSGFLLAPIGFVSIFSFLPCLFSPFYSFTPQVVSKASSLFLLCSFILLAGTSVGLFLIFFILFPERGTVWVAPFNISSHGSTTQKRAYHQVAGILARGSMLEVNKKELRKVMKWLSSQFSELSTDQIYDTNFWDDVNHKLKDFFKSRDSFTIKILFQTSQIR